MHKLASTPITLDCFETDDYNYEYAHSKEDLYKYIYPEQIINWLEELRLKYLETGDKAYWKELIRWLPESWLQTRTITMNYENILNLIHQRHNHKLSEWQWLVNKFRKELPYAYELLFFTLDKKVKGEKI